MPGSETHLGVLVIADVGRGRIQAVARAIFRASRKCNSAPFERFPRGGLLLDDFGAVELVGDDGETFWQVWLSFTPRATSIYSARLLADFDQLLAELFKRESWRDRPPML